MALGKGYDRQDCSLARALEVVGERWTLLVLRDCVFGARRFRDLRDRLDMPRAVLTDRLNALVEEGLLVRRPYQTGRDEYLPTDKAIALWPAIYALREWGEQYYPPAQGRRRFFTHVQCGTDIDGTGHCPSCGTMPAPGDLETRPGPGADMTLRDDQVSVALYETHRLLTPLP
ncbi:winged helix-turn-helix transcriptional regulator [Pseudonocardia spinosispora]|uniref:winged helix-turn-helix transcriptional regulator n=1 Tax=Pseudonocardia spinosispora TaxID=103441 RepID=UPI00042754F4|nr:helix-turn-helix domain-containing protein [Pseudonocardia spinosispora]